MADEKVVENVVEIETRPNPVVKLIDDNKGAICGFIVGVGTTILTAIIVGALSALDGDTNNEVEA